MVDPAPAVAVADLPPGLSPAVFDPLVVHPGRLSILLALSAGGDAGGGSAEFVDLRRRTRLTDGNLASHAKRLSAGGLIGVDKRFRAGRPVTTYLLTPAGRHALRAHVDGLVSAVAGAGAEGGTGPDDSVADARTRQPPAGRAAVVPAAAPSFDASDDDDWID